MSGMSLKGEELKVRTEGETLEGGGGGMCSVSLQIGVRVVRYLTCSGSELTDQMF